MFVLTQSSGTAGLANSWPTVVGLGVVVVVVVGAIVYAMRKFFRDTRAQHEEEPASAPSVANPAAFMTASMQGVIQKLRDQEKELERLHKAEKERAEHTERPPTQLQAHGTGPLRRDSAP